MNFSKIIKARVLCWFESNGKSPPGICSHTVFSFVSATLTWKSEVLVQLQYQEVKLLRKL